MKEAQAFDETLVPFLKYWVGRDHGVPIWGAEVCRTGFSNIYLAQILFKTQDIV